MKKFTTIIIDDEKPARDLIHDFLKSFDEIVVAGEADNGFEACKMILAIRPDLLFLDIQMPKLSGMELLELIDKPLPFIIFSTAYDQYAVEAFEKNAIDYLLKPYNRARFVQAVKRFLKNMNENPADKPQININKLQAPGTMLNRLPVRSGTKILVLRTDQIKYIKAENDYVRIASTEGNYLKQVTMAYLEKSLPELVFVRIHRSYILNINYLKQLDVYDRQGYTAVTIEGEKLPVSRNGATRLNQLINLD